MPALLLLAFNNQMSETTAKFKNHWLIPDEADCTAHIIPVDDLKPHTESKHCKCKPEIQRTENGTLIVHYSYDGREFFE